MVIAILVIIAFVLGFEIRDRIQQKIYRDADKWLWEKWKKANAEASEENEEYRKRLNELITD